MSNGKKVVIVLLLILVVAFAIFYINNGLSLFDKNKTKSSGEELVVLNNVQVDYYNQLQEEQEEYRELIGYYNDNLDEEEEDNDCESNLDWEVTNFMEDSRSENTIFFSGIIENKGNEAIEAGTTWRIDFGDGNYEEGIIGQTIEIGGTYNIAQLNSYVETGNYEVNLIIDYEDDVSEFDETNNQVSIDITI